MIKGGELETRRLLVKIFQKFFKNALKQRTFAMKRTENIRGTSLRSGDDIKTVQGNLGHATAAFASGVHGHVTNQMQEASAVRMEAYIKGILKL